MLVSKAFFARAEPVLYRRLEISYVCQAYYDGESSDEDYNLERASDGLVHTLQAKQGYAQWCSALTIGILPDERNGRRMSTTPLTAPSLQALLERLAAVTSLTVAPLLRWNHRRALSVLVAVLPAIPSFCGLRTLRLPYLADNLPRWLLSLSHLTSVTLQSGLAPLEPLPALTPTFRLTHFGVGRLSGDLFALLTANSLTSLTSLAAPYSFPFETSLARFPHLTSLTLTFDRYSNDPSSSRSPGREALKHFLEANTTLRSLTFSHATDYPGPRRTALLRALPPHLEVLRLRPYPLRSQTALDLVPDLPATLRKVEWTPWSSNGPWKSGRRESVEEACKARRIQERSPDARDEVNHLRRNTSRVSSVPTISTNPSGIGAHTKDFDIAKLRQQVSQLKMQLKEKNEELVELMYDTSGMASGGLLRRGLPPL
ncbi:hypothetical protein JCM10213_003601 [Rhodosporidiobolus nylandii]